MSEQEPKQKRVTAVAKERSAETITYSVVTSNPQAVAKELESRGFETNTQDV